MTRWMIRTAKLAGKFNSAHQLKRTENVLKGNEMRETAMEVLLKNPETDCYEIKKTKKEPNNGE